MDTLVLILRVALSLAAVLGLLWVLQKRLGKGARVRKAGGGLAVVARQGLGRKASVVLLETDGRRLLLGVTEHSVTVLQAGEGETETAAAAAVTAPRLEAVRARQFAEVLDATGTDGTARAASESATPAVSEPGGEPLALRPRRNRHQAPASSGLAGSILSPATWRQTTAALRQAR